MPAAQLPAADQRLPTSSSDERLGGSTLSSCRQELDLEILALGPALLHELGAGDRLLRVAFEAQRLGPRAGRRRPALVGSARPG